MTDDASLTRIKLERLRQLKKLQSEAAKVNTGVAQYYNDPVAFAHDCIDWRDHGLTAYQEDILNALKDKRRVAVRGPHGLGKAQGLSTVIAQPTGWTTIGEIKVGDELYDEDGYICRVTAKSEIWHGPTYEVEFADGSVVTTHGNHEWNAIDVYNRPKGVKDWRDHWDATRVVTTEQMARTLRSPAGQLRWRIPTARPLVMPEAELLIDPYLFGYWLGDGNSDSARITVHENDWPNLLDQIKSADYHHGKIGRCKSAPKVLSVTVSTTKIEPGKKRDSMFGRLREIGVLGNKHIPMQYKRSSVAQRRELVRGLWDSDGYRQAGGSDEIMLTNKRLAEDVAELLRTLGLVVRVSESRAKLNGKDYGPRWRIAARFDFNPYHLSRYGWQPRDKQASRHTQRTIVDIRKIEDQPTQCIEVDSPSHLYLTGSSMIPTHNSAVSAVTVLWFALTRDATGTDWKIVTTAGAWRQLINYLWPEVHKWTGRIKWDKVRDKPFTGSELMNLNLRLKFGSAFAAAASNPALIEGAHADSLLFIYDESKAIVAGTFDACEGAFSGTGESYAMALSTPGPPQGRFYDIHARKPGYEDWYVRHVTLDEAKRAGRISDDWAEQRKLQWGENSALYQNRVLGEFYAGEEDSVIPLSWVEAAVERWHDWDEAGRIDPGIPHTVGVDVARSGTDKTCMAIRQGHVITEVRAYTHNDTMTTTGRVQNILEGDPSMTAIVDVVGVGAGVVDRLRETGAKVQPFSAAARTRNRDRSNELSFANVRAAAWWNLREQLDPTFNPEVCLPPDDELLSDLTAPKAGEPLSGGKLKIESKDEIKKRIGRSTDRGDAVVQSFWAEMGNWHDAYGTASCPECRTGFVLKVNGVERTECPHCGFSLLDPEDEIIEEKEFL